MVAIVSGSSLGINLSSLATLGQQGAAGAATQGSNGERVFVNAATGNLVLQSEDDHLVARGPDSVALRTYNSQGLLNDDNGDNWSSGFWLQPLALAGTLNAAGSTLSRTDRDGSVAVYTFDGSKYTSPDGAGAYDTLRFVAADNQLEWTDGDTGTTERYQASGAFRLLSARDTAGNALVYGYNAAGRLASVVTASGDTTFYDYSGNNLVQIRTVTSSGAANTDIRYGYDAANRLSTVTVDLSPGDNAIADGNVFTTTYSYDGASKRVARIAQSDGSSLAFTYTADGKVATVADGLGQVSTFTYAAGSLVVRDPLGLATTYTVDASKRLATIATPVATTSFGYNAAGDLLSVQDGEGRTTVYQYDTNGNRVLERDAAGNTITRSFDARNQLLAETRYAAPDPDGAGALQPGLPVTQRYAYDSRGLLRFAVSPEGRLTEHRYDGFGQRVATLVYNGGFVPAGAAPLAEADLATWAAAQPASAVQRVDFSYDARGSLQARTSYARLDAAGSGVVDGTQSRETYVYDQNGWLLQVVSATGASSAYSYDGFGRIRTSTDALGQVTTTAYSDVTIRKVTWLANGRVLDTQYDAAGRLVSAGDLTPAPAYTAFGTTRYFNDAGGRLRMTEDPTGVREWMLYDDAGRKVGEVDGNGTLTEYGYDRNGQLVATVRYDTLVNTALLVNASGVPIYTATLAAIRPAATGADVRSWRMYDAANRLVREAHTVGTGSAVAVSEMRYDGLSRLTDTIRYLNTLETASIVGGVINLPVASAEDRRVRSFYSADGQLTATVDAEGYFTGYAYDAAGQLRERITYATRVDASLPAGATAAQLQPPAAAADIRDLWFYDGKGQQAFALDAEGYLTETVRDAAGKVTQTVRYANRVTQPVTAGSDIAALRPAASPTDRATLRNYDALGRVVQETSPEGVVTQYGYDSVGNLVSTTQAAGTAEVRTLLARYDVQGRLTGQLSAEGAALLTGGQTQAQVDAIWAQYGIAHVYDAAGRRISSTDALGNRTLFFYNADDALTHTVNALGEVRETRYDRQGRVSEEIAYATRIATAGLAGLAGGLATTAFTSLVVANAALDSRTTTTYTRDDHVATTADALGNITSHGYNAFGDEISTVDGSNVAQTYTVDHRGLRTGTLSDAGGIAASTTIVFDAFGRVVRMVDANFNLREQAFDRLGRVVLVRDPTGAATQTTYDAFARVVAQTDALGRVTTYAYDNAARSVAVTSPEGVRVVTTYTRHGQVLSLTDGKGQVTTYGYDRNGRLASTTTPLLTTSTSRYDAAGRLIETTDAAGTKVAYSYDAVNRVLSRRVDPNGLNLTTLYQYDAQGRQVQVTDPAGVVTAFSYDRKGQLLQQQVDPAGLNLRTTYTWDARGKTLSVTAPGGTVTQYVYDALGRRVQERVDPAGLNLQRSWSYDKAGNVRTATDATGNVTRYVYDAAGRLAFEVDAAGDVQQTTYDAAGRVTRTAAYATPIAVSALPADPAAADVQALLVSQPAGDRVEHRVYDGDGRLVATVDGTGAVVRYAYDANGNVVSRTAYATAISLAAWPPGTLPAPVAKPLQDAQLRTVYDAGDRAIYTIDGTGAVVAQTFDGAGRLLQRVAYAAPVPTSTAATASAVAAALAPLANPLRDASVRNIYDAAGRLAWSADGLGGVTQKVYDRNGNVVREIAYATAIAAGASPATAAASAADRVTTRAYDAANRLTFQVNAVNAVTEFAYDANGNVVRRTEYATALPGAPATGTLAAIRSALAASPSLDRTTLYGYDAAGRQALVVDPTGAVSETQYDAAGRRLATISYATRIVQALPPQPTLAGLKALVRTAAADRVTRYAYDAAGRLAFTVSPLWAVTAMQYDALGRVLKTTRYYNPIAAGTQNTVAAITAALVSKANAGVDQAEQFSYDAAGRVLRDTDAVGTAEVYAYDALGNKLSFTNRKNATWTYSYDAAGRVLTETSPQVAIGSVTVNGTGDLVAGTSVTAAIVTRMAYDALGQLASRTEAAGRAGEERTTGYEYDAVGHQVRVLYPSFSVYDAAADAPTSNGSVGVATRAEKAATLETRTYYDVLGNAVAARDVGGAITQKVYDSAGRLAYDIDALGYLTRYSRNAFGEVTSLVRYAKASTLANGSITQASQAATKAQADAALAAAGFVQPGADRTVVTAYDAAGRSVEVAEPAAYVSELNAGGARVSGAVSRTTRKTYNAFGEITEERALRNAAGEWSVTSRAYDAGGRETATVDALGYLTKRSFDTRGNLTAQTEYATALTGNWSADAYSGLSTNIDDRTIQYAYDRLDRVTSQTRSGVEFSTAADGNSTRSTVVTGYGYDALGNRTRVTDANGGITYTYYDVLGRVVAIAAPARAVDNGAGVLTTLTPLTVFTRDAYGNEVARTEYAKGAATSNGTTWSAAAATAEDRRTLTRYDLGGHVVQTTDALGASEFFSYDASGHLAKQWQGVLGSDGVTRTAFTLNFYDKLGNLLETRTPASTSVDANGAIAQVTQQQAGVVATQMEYDAFGEMIRRGTNGGRQEFFDHDVAGRLWRTNSGDGSTRIQLFDAQGHVTAEIRSAGAGNGNVDVAVFAEAAAADDNQQTRRVDTRYDASGRAVASLQAARQQVMDAIASVQRQYTTATVTRSAQAVYGGSGWGPDMTLHSTVALRWNSLTPLGSGDVKVVVGYRTPLVATTSSNESSTSTTYTGGTARSYASGVYSSEQAAGGVDLDWGENPDMAEVGIGDVTRIQVYKKDLYGNWQLVIDQAPGYGANEVDVVAPADPAAATVLEMRKAGSAGDTGWWTAGAMNFGERLRFDASGLAAGGYEYRVKVTSPGQATRTVATGKLTLALPPLNSINAAIGYGPAGDGILAWQTPGANVAQVLRYRPAGSSADWFTLAVSRRLNQLDGADTRGLAAGSYQFELLWTPSGVGVPTAHATGTFTVAAAQAAYWVPPVNLPAITGLRVGVAAVNGTAVATIEWNAANANYVRYSSNGTTWTTLAVDSSLVQYDENGQVQGSQRVLLNGVAPNGYLLEVYAGYPSPSSQAKASFTVYPQSAGYYQTVYVSVPVYTPIIASYAPVWETRYGTRTVSYQVWVSDTPVFMGYGENGQPVYAYPGHYETRTTTETYAYQVQVGQTPVYARDENGSIRYSVSYVQQAQQVWVPGTTPKPTLSVTTPPYTPGYTVAAVPVRYSASVSTAGNSSAISTGAGAVVAQAATSNSDAQWLRPQVLQKFDRWGNVVEISDPRSVYWKTTYRYNANNQLVQQTLPDDSGNAGAASPVTSLFYDKLGRQLAVRDANGNINGQVFDAGGNLVQEKHADTGQVTYGYSIFGERVRTVSAEGRIVTYTFDKRSRVLSAAKGVEEVYQVDGRAAVRVDTRNLTETWTYDQLGHALTHRNGNLETTTYSYDLAGNLVATTQPLGQVTRAAFDAQGRKTAEVDALGNKATWRYDYFGLLQAHMDIAGVTFAYTYDKARQLLSQTSGRGQSLAYVYDAAGQVVQLTDAATGKVTRYTYDLGGRHVREQTLQGGVVFQDNHLAYDTRGNLRDVADARVHLAMQYDKLGNRTRISSFVDYQGVAGEASSGTERYFKYDAMNRQVVVDAVDAAFNIGQQGHQLTYDHDGNRTSDTSWGNRIVTAAGQTVITGYNASDDSVIYTTLPTTFVRGTGVTTEQYRYDALSRLTSVVKDGVQIDLRRYDGADRVIQSGPAGALPSGNYGDLINEGVAPGDINGKERRLNRYDANGRLLQQAVLTPDGHEKVDILYDPNRSVVEGGVTYTPDGYDAAGNVLGYVVQNHEAGIVNEYRNSFRRFEGYQVDQTSATSSRLTPGSNTQQYDANGYLTGVTDSTQHANDRSFVNDAQGRALAAIQGANVQRQLVVNGEVLGIYGAGPDPLATGANPTFANLVDFDFYYAKVSASYPAPSPGAYTVRAGDTLQSIAQGAYGDSSLWYRIAEANGLGSSKDLKVGTTLNIPNRVSTIGNNNTTFKPYDPSRIEGDKTPNMAMPKNDSGCGGVGTLIMVIVAVVATIFTAGLLAPVCTASLGATFSAGLAAITSGTVGVVGGAIAGAVGSIASQVVGLATGNVQKFSWKSVALSSVSNAVSAGIGGTAFNEALGGPLGGAAARAALANAAVQGVGVATGLQKTFDWRGVAASAVGAGVGQAVAPALGSELGRLGGRIATGLIAGTAAAVARGGRIAIEQVAIDAFGNALGSSLTEGASGVSVVENTTPSTGDFTRMDRIGDPYKTGYQDSRGHLVADEEQLARVMDQGPLLVGRGAVVFNAPYSAPGDTATLRPQQTPWTKDQLRLDEIRKRIESEREAWLAAAPPLTPTSSTPVRGSDTFSLDFRQAPSVLTQTAQFFNGLASSAATALFGGDGAFKVTPTEEAAWKLVNPSAAFGERPTLEWSIDIQAGTATRAIGTTSPFVDQLKGAVSLGLLPAGQGLGAFFGGLSVAGDESYSLATREQASYEAGASSLTVPAVASLAVIRGPRNAVAVETLTVQREIAFRESFVGPHPELTGPVFFKAPPNATAAEISQVEAYILGSNEAVVADALSPTGRVSTAGAIRQQGSREAALERARAAEAGRPYVGQAGHVPDKTWLGLKPPHSWLDLDARVNASLGGQAGNYPLGLKPYVFVFDK